MTTEIEIEKAFSSKREFFDKGLTKPYKFRATQLKKLKNSIKNHERQIVDALYKDLHKPEMEAYISEVGFMYEEISYIIKHLRKWMKPQRVHTPMVLHPSSSRIYAEPLGVVLIIAPWNYPFQLIMAPLAGAIAAGNCAIIKPSDNTRNTSAVIEEIIKETFNTNYISVVTGPGAMVGQALIEKYPFNHIFFTGSPSVGKQVMAMAAKRLTPVTLELGGKSPVIVDKNININVTARRLVWAKFFNAGQTCVCPDYLLIHEDIKSEFVDKMIKTIKEFYGGSPDENESITYIVNQKRFNTLVSYLDGVNILYGGQHNAAKRYIAPTIVDQVPKNHPIMNEEIFGPILPVLTFRNIEEVLPVIREHRYPLACYIFTNSSNVEKFIIQNVEFGGGCINNALTHLANPALPFGGVGNSGMGRYHGKYSFEVFSHFKSILKTSPAVDPALRYPPYTKSKREWITRFFE